MEVEQAAEELNEYGKLVFISKTRPRVFLEKPYRWVDRSVVIDESDGKTRKVVESVSFSLLLSGLYDDWIPMTFEQYEKGKSFYYESSEWPSLYQMFSQLK